MNSSLFLKNYWLGIFLTRIYARYVFQHCSSWFECPIFSFRSQIFGTQRLAYLSTHCIWMFRTSDKFTCNKSPNRLTCFCWAKGHYGVCKKRYDYNANSNLDIAKSLSNPFCSLFRIIHYLKCIMHSKSSKLELGFVHYITKFTISRFVIARFQCSLISKLTSDIKL